MEHDRPPVLERAVSFVAGRHLPPGQIDGLSYLFHLTTVARLLAQAGFSQEVQAAGLIHGLWRLGGPDARTVRHQLGKRVFDLAAPLVEDEITISDRLFEAKELIDYRPLSWLEKKRRLLARLPDLSLETRAILLADRLDDLESLGWAMYQADPEVVWQRLPPHEEAHFWFYFGLRRKILTGLAEVGALDWLLTRYRSILHDLWEPQLGWDEERFLELDKRFGSGPPDATINLFTLP